MGAEGTRGTKAILVTGGSRGIGAGIAKLFAERGWLVALTYQTNQSAADRVVTEIDAAGGSAMALRCNVRKWDDVRALFEELDRRGVRLSALVNNAAVTGPKTRLDGLTPEVLAEVVETNLVGLIACCQEGARRMSTDRGGAGGVIVNISSTGTNLGNPGQWVHYAATKGAVDVLTKGLARELAPEGIRVAAVAPGLTNTDPALEDQVNARLVAMGSEIPMGRAGTVTEVAEGVYWLCSDAASYCTGVVLAVAGGR